MAHFREAVRIAPDYVDAHNNLGIALDRRGSVDEAMAQLRGGLAPSDPSSPESTTTWHRSSPEVHNNLGIALARSGRTQEAIAQFREALRFNPDFAPARDALRKLEAPPE